MRDIAIHFKKKINAYDYFKRKSESKKKFQISLNAKKGKQKERKKTRIPLQKKK